MPEIVECEKLRADLQRQWLGRRIVSFVALGKIPADRFVEGVEWNFFEQKVLNAPISDVRRVAKNILVMIDAQRMWHIHLSSTGWLKRVSGEGKDPSDRQFLHSTEAPSHRIRIILDDGQEWVYSDSRSWGRWYLRKGVHPEQDPYLATFGPDWLIDPHGAALSLVTSTGNRRAKDVLCDQHLTSGLGNYLACEALHLAHVHPHQRWEMITKEGRMAIVVAINQAIREAMLSPTKEHWRVFKRGGKECPSCKDLVTGEDGELHSHKIEYRKDSGGQRGSYFCSFCQPLMAGGEPEQEEKSLILRLS